jgi:hypothetical protein
MSKLQYFPEEWSSSHNESDVEVHGIKGGWVYVIRDFNTEGAPVPAMDAYLVAVWDDGEREEFRTNNPAEITLWTKHLQ